MFNPKNQFFSVCSRLVFFTLVFIQILLIAANNIQAQSITLVDFGSSASGNSFGLAGWSQVIKSNKMVYSSAGPDGLVLGSSFDEFTDFQGVKGNVRQFSRGERIVVTWYNNSSQEIRFYPRISLDDPDQPDGGSVTGKWFTMRRFDDYREAFCAIQPQSSIKSAFNIETEGVHKTNGNYSIVNINLHIEWEQQEFKAYLICDKIELMNDADITPPEKVTGLSASPLSDSKIKLEWNPGSDNVGVVEYLIYLNGKIEGYSRTNSYTAVFLEPAKEYRFTVTALDHVRNESAHSDPAIASTQKFSGATDLIHPDGLQYLGAIRLPESMSYGGDAIAYNSDGDGGQSGSGASDGFPGSIFVTDLNQQEHGFVAEMTIPKPIISPSKNLDELNEPAFIQQPANIRPANVNNWPYVDVWRTGLAYISDGAKLYSSWGFHYQLGEEKTASLSCCDANNLKGSTKRGAWFIGTKNQFPVDPMLNDYLFAVPQSWANDNLSGRSILTGRYRDGGLSGLGPTLYAVSPVHSATLPSAGAELPLTKLLQYGSVEGTDNYHYPNSIDGYKHSDAWRDANWISVPNQSSVMIIGNKAMGDNWYGYQRERLLHDWLIADTPEPEFWSTDAEGKGWQAHHWVPMAILFDPADLANVAKGNMDFWSPQPYAAVRFDESTFWGAKQEITSACYDPVNHFLYITEFNAPNEGRLLLHVWKVDAVTTSVLEQDAVPGEYRLTQNFPNPFNSATYISYSLPEAKHVILKIYTVNGQEIKTLVDQFQPAGAHAVAWDGLNVHGQKVCSGIYLYQFQAGSFAGSKKMLLIE
ncbi:T9SS type A sorting domain-containing protein [candidate division KSB1 bacterium]|nr:T9SS type A sorting domain-containing protein [candidate division KSB1 bacterium]